MHIVTDILQYDKRPCAATIGSFDGVHRGHIAMLGELRAAATAKGLPLMVVTFAIHPRMLFNEGCAPFLLTPTRKKLELLEAAGVDICVLLDFDHAMAAMSAQQFMNKILVERLGVQMLAVGYDHHFGRPAPGEELEQYIEYGKEMGIEVFGTQPYNVDGTVVSSSAVRRALSAGDAALAAAAFRRCHLAYIGNFTVNDIKYCIIGTMTEMVIYASVSCRYCYLHNISSSLLYSIALLI